MNWQRAENPQNSTITIFPVKSRRHTISTFTVDRILNFSENIAISPLLASKIARVQHIQKDDGITYINLLLYYLHK